MRYSPSRMLNTSKIKAISLDLDDTLWPIRPTIERAEKALHLWLTQHAPMTAALFSSAEALADIRKYTVTEVAKKKPELQYDLSAVRRESIRTALQRAHEDPQLAEAAFDVFFAERNKVTLFDDVMPALRHLSQKFPLVSLSNGNADLHKVGIASYFKATISARDLRMGKPDARVFHAAAQAAGVAPHEVLHVGDDMALDVLGALNAGLKAAWILREGLSTLPVQQQPTVTVGLLTELCDWLD
jgi:FMN hydrolase / 5-amino-6-(5-phospho-D-ribitylamino)uracil phosphatase